VIKIVVFLMEISLKNLGVQSSVGGLGITFIFAFFFGGSRGV
jgi:hypothetical protein